MYYNVQQKLFLKAELHHGNNVYHVACCIFYVADIYTLLPKFNWGMLLRASQPEWEASIATCHIRRCATMWNKIHERQYTTCHMRHIDPSA